MLVDPATTDPERARLVELYLPLAVSVARRFASCRRSARTTWRRLQRSQSSGRSSVVTRRGRLSFRPT